MLFQQTILCNVSYKILIFILVIFNKITDIGEKEKTKERGA